MRISDRYIGKEVITGTLYAVMVLGIILVLGNLYKQIQPLLVDQKAPAILLFRFVLTILPLSLMYTVPWGFLTAVLMVFGRMSASHEITSFRVAGMSLWRLATPVFVIAVLLSALSLWLNVKIVPLAKSSSRELIYEQAVRDPGSLLKPGVIFGDAKGNGEEVQKLLIEGRDREWLSGFHFYSVPDAQSKESNFTYVHATRAALSVNAEKSQLILKLQDAYFEFRNEKGEIQSAFAGEAEPLVIDLKNTTDRKIKPKLMTNSQIRHELEANLWIDPKSKKKMETEIMTRFSFSMACLAFAFIAVPLGLQTQRRDTSRGLMVSVLIGTGYFLITLLADQVKSPILSATILWTPNALCVLGGLFLFHRARFSR